MFRKMSSLAGLVFAVTLVSVACSGSSGGSGGGPIRPLSANEETRLKTAVKAMGEVTNLGAAFATARSTGSTRPVVHGLFAQFLQPTTPPAPSKLKEVIDQSNCQKTMKFPDESDPLKAGDSTIGVFSYDVSGPGCPLRYHAELTGTQLYDANQKPNGFKALLKYEYEALTQEARDAADVDRMNMHGDIDVKVDELANGTTMKFVIAFGGTGHSQKEGDFKVSDAFDGDIRVTMGSGSSGPNPQPAPPGENPFPNIDIAGTMAEKMLFSFKDMNAELTGKVVMSGFSQTTDFRINGKTVTQEEFEEYRKALNVPGMDDKEKQTPGPGPGPGPASVLSCEARVYLRSEIEPGALQTELDAGRLPQLRPRTHFEACSAFGPRQDFRFPDGDHDIDYSFNFSPTFSQASVDICSSTDVTNCNRVKRAFLADETRGFADAAGKYTVMIRCEAKASCF
ncbi:MAG: hypothetical protein V4760_06190 [Bdellovibrionota bacterium]